MDLIHLDFVIGLGPGVERAADAAPAELRVGAGESAAGAAAATAATAATTITTATAATGRRRAAHGAPAVAGPRRTAARHRGQRRPPTG